MDVFSRRCRSGVLIAALFPTLWILWLILIEKPGTPLAGRLLAAGVVYAGCLLASAVAFVILIFSAAAGSVFGRGLADCWRDLRADHRSVRARRAAPE